MRVECVPVVLSLVLLAGCGGGEKEKSRPSAAEERLAPVVAKKTKDDPKPEPDTPDTPPPSSDDGPISVPLAIRNLSSNDPQERLEAVHALANAPFDEAVVEKVASGLIRRLTDAEKGVRSSAVVALKKWARPSDVEAVAGLLARSEPDIRHRAIEVLMDLKTPEAAEHVAGRLTSAFDRAQAKLALFDMGAIAEPPLLETYVEDTDAEVRLATVELLEEIGGPDSIDPLVELQEDPDPRVATAAAKALMAVEQR